uniref:Uncharacterized protein n=1 Tax=Candidatus Kentrum sp. UNK TaxID=2126344 RepID=A0A451AMM3_9GAMM|nr:MAG: hypothetical protein BECKUNK1418G_GA0071005_11347 [Candidatus Kentron sp. UNK]VFK72624.1 MAG: hypothetical protein BECKUNK1418H_GA0071006_11267 [Candidatus Kentron sp. UNK]
MSLPKTLNSMSGCPDVMLESPGRYRTPLKSHRAIGRGQGYSGSRCVGIGDCIIVHDLRWTELVCETVGMHDSVILELTTHPYD